MKRQPWSSALKRLSLIGAFVFAISLLELLAPARASAVQLFIESAFVHEKNNNCVVEVFNGVPRFRCPPITRPVGGVDPCGGVTSPSCRDQCTQVGGLNNRCPSLGPCDPSLSGDPNCAAAFSAAGTGSVFSIGNHYGNISNDPEINFDTEAAATLCHCRFSGLPPAGGSCPGGLGPSLGVVSGESPLPTGSTVNNVCNASVFLCAGVGYGNNDTTSNPDIAIDSIEFEIFKFQNGTNPNDAGSAPPLRTFFIDAPGVLPANSTSASSGPLGPFCVLWDGSYNIQGTMGKTNGFFGFRGTVVTNQTGASGNIQISAVRSYPASATFDGVDRPTTYPGNQVSQQPVLVNVANVHVVASSPTLVGSITPIPAQPYNIFYRLSKDATMYITIAQPPDPTVTPGTSGQIVRTILNGVARVGEGIPNGTLSNGDSWNGRADNGDLLPSGAYLATLQASSRDQWGDDLSQPTTVQIGLDPLQITDIRVTPLAAGSTSLAVLAYVLTEPATIFVDIYPPGTQFCNVIDLITGRGFNPLNNVSNSSLDQPSPLPPKNFNASLSNCGPSGAAPALPANPVKRIQTQQNSRASVISFWDGRDQTGNEVPDGDYVFVIYAALPSQNGAAFNGVGTDKRVWTNQAKSGFITIDRGFVGISQVQPGSAIVGSSPPVAGLNPFRFSYSLSRDAIVNMAIFDNTGQKLIRHLVVNETRPGNGFPNVEVWPDGTDDNGLMVTSGTYLVQLTATDPTFPTMVSTTTALFPVDLYRIADIATVPILGGASDFVLLSYQLTQPMFVTLNIFSPGTVVIGSSATWPPCLDPSGGPCSQVLTGPFRAPGSQPAVPLIQIKGMRTGRLRITEQWDGRDVNGNTVPDGQYVYTLIAQSTTTPTYFASDKTYGTVIVNRGLITINPFSVTPDIPTTVSSQTITLHPYTISYSVNRQSSVTIQILNTAVPPAVIRNIIVGQVRQNGILLQEVWDGRDTFGNFPPAGFYLVRAFANDVASQLNTPATAQVTIGYDPLRIYDVLVNPLSLGTGNSSIFFQVSEPMKVAVKIYRPGTSFDLEQNPSPPDSISLIKRIIATEPARVQVEDVWDGTDLTFTKVPDGIYKFLILGSTATSAIDSLTGNIVSYSALADDKIVDDIPVVRNGSLDPEGDFKRNSFVYPNPVNGPAATISVYSPIQADLKINIYNVAGQLVLQQDLGQVAPSYVAGNATYVWPKANQSGRPVGRGIYLVVVRLEDTLGGKTVLQDVKRVLIP